ncbi:MAG: dTMP kinase [Polyangiaceae bacterium]|nr:dTMP kinase [Polyangiaceae bacterium]
MGASRAARPRAASAQAASGRFVVLEGIDGAGTTTQARRLVDALRERGVDARLTAEPSAGPVGSLIRLALARRVVVADAAGSRPPGWATLALLFAADRLDHVEQEIAPALAAGAVVVCDRYDLSSLVYQSCTSPEGDGALPFVRAVNARALRPDLVFVLDVPPAVAAGRRAARGAPPELFERDSLQARLARGYARAEELVPGDRVVHVDGAQGVDEVFARLLEATLGVLSGADGPGGGAARRSRRR